MPQALLSERDVEHYLKRLFEDVPDFHDIRSDVPIGGGRADLVIYADKRPYIVVEVKRQSVDPFDIDVVNQAAGYAVESGASYFATTNGRRFVLFETFRAGVPLMQRRLKVFEVSATLAAEVLDQLSTGIKWLAIDDAFLARLNTLHEVLTPGARESLRRALRSPPFRRRFEQWTQGQGFPYRTEKQKHGAEEIAASQATYLLVNKILFYKILETGYPQLPKLTAAATADLPVRLHGCFEHVLKIDYRAVYEERIFDEIPLTSDGAGTLGNFIRELESYDFSEIKSDVIGRIYERLIPLEERKALGQYYTPPQIVDLILRLTLKDPNAKVLDPSCGSGGFLVKAYHRLLELRGKEKATSQKEHQQVLDQLTGVEINQFPAHLSVINLEMQNISYKSDRINVLVSDFFDVQNFGFNRQHAVAHLDKAEARSPAYRFFDAIVANPPYIRQEQIKQKRKLLQLMSHYGAHIDKTSDIYAYFFVHASHFLRPGGRLGFITSNKWLEVRYGARLQQFLLNHHRVLAVIEFDAAAFEEALVNTCVVILEKEKEAARRDSNLVKFMRVKRPFRTGDIVKAIEAATASSEDAGLRITLVPQKELRNSTKWSLYIRAPPIYSSLVNHPKMTVLQKVADVRRGITTGAKEFFYVDEAAIKAWGIEKTYLSPVLISPRRVTGLVLTRGDAKTFVLNVHKNKADLRGTNVLKYIEHGESRDYHLRPTTKNRRRWFDIGNRSPPAILCARLIWNKPVFVWNKADALANDIFYEIRPHNIRDVLVLLGFLNSSVASLLFESLGRSYGGGVLELKVYEAKQFPVIDPTRLSPSDRTRIEQATLELGERQTERGQHKLDSAVFDVLAFGEAEREAVYRSLKEARKLRTVRREKGVLVE